MERGSSKEGASGRPMDERGYLASHPPELRIEGAIEEIRRRVVETGRRVAVLDDDPTGVQSVHGVPVLTTWGSTTCAGRSNKRARRSSCSPTPAASPKRRPWP
jgi:hypothetical protein